MTCKIAQNKQKLILIILTIIFCGLHNISLREHRDNGFIYYDEVEDSNGMIKKKEILKQNYIVF